MGDEERLLRFAINLVIFSLLLFLLDKIIGRSIREKCETDPAVKIARESCEKRDE